MMKTDDFIARLKQAAALKNTYYVQGAFGWYKEDASRLSSTGYNNAHKTDILKNWKNNWKFDCCGLIKAVFWGWNCNETASYGGAKYASNGVPDANDAGLMKACKEISTDFTKIAPGEAVGMSGHIGVYIGGGKVVESTPAWDSRGVKISDIGSKGERSLNGKRSGSWISHGKLPWVEYSAVSPAPPSAPVAAPAKSTDMEVKITMKLPELKQGDKGYAVSFLQSALNIKSQRPLIDGSFGPDTCAKVKAFQAANKLTADGIVGTKTWENLLS